MNIISKLCCRHHWSVLIDHKDDSFVERLAKLSYEADGARGRSLFTATRTQILSCTKCGKIKRYVTEI